jgi:hypothetical protein
LYDTDIPSDPGETTDVKSPGWRTIAVRKGSISEALLTTLCARKTPPGSSLG